MTYRKNKKRIDPRYFLEEKTDLTEDYYKIDPIIREEYEKLLREHTDSDCTTELIHSLLQGLSVDDVDEIFQQVYSRIVGPEPRSIGFQTNESHSDEDIGAMEKGDPRKKKKEEEEESEIV